MDTPELERCKLCNTVFISSKELKNGMCHSCALDVAWRKFIFSIAESLRIHKFAVWLAEKITLKNKKE